MIIYRNDLCIEKTNEFWGPRNFEGHNGMASARLPVIQPQDPEPAGACPKPLIQTIQTSGQGLSFLQQSTHASLHLCPTLLASRIPLHTPHYSQAANPNQAGSARPSCLSASDTLACSLDASPFTRVKLPPFTCKCIKAVPAFRLYTCLCKCNMNEPTPIRSSYFLP